jgi:hypothetical protein
MRSCGIARRLIATLYTMLHRNIDAAGVSAECTRVSHCTLNSGYTFGWIS